MSLYEVRNSLIHGKGCFAITLITKDTIIDEYTGKIISQEEYDQLVLQGKADHIVVCNGILIDGMQGGNNACYLNHSCNPNVSYFIQDDRFFFKAKKDIQKGEELTWDYEYEEDEIYSCDCKSAECRGFMNAPLSIKN